MRDEGKTIAGNLTLREIASIVQRSRKHIHYLDNCADSAFQNLTFYNGGEYDGAPYEETITVKRKRSGTEGLSREDCLWEIVIGYVQTNSDEFDYRKVVRHDNNTAHKIRASGPPREVKFRLTNYWHPYQTEKQLMLAGEDLSRLGELVDRLEIAVESLAGWVAQGFNAAVICRTAYCRKPVIISAVRLKSLHESGLDLEGLKEKLVCRECGARGPSIMPAP